MTKYPVVSLHHAKGCELELVLTKSMKKLKQWTYDSPSAVPSGRLLSKAKFATPGLPSRPSSVPPATRGHSRDTQPAPRSPAGTPLSTRGAVSDQPGTACQAQGARAAQPGSPDVHRASHVAQSGSRRLPG